MTEIYRVGQVWNKAMPREIVRIIDEDGGEHQSTEGLTTYRIQWRRLDRGQIRHNLGVMWRRWAAGAVCTRGVHPWGANP